MIEAWRSRQDHRAQIRQLEHVFQVDARIGGLARHQDQLAALLEGDVGGTLDQVVAGPGGNRRQGAGGTGHHHHGGRRTRARSRRRHPVLLGEHADLPSCGTGVFAEKGLHRLRLGRQHHIGLGGHHQLRRLGDEEVHLAILLNQAVEQAQAVLRAGGAGHGQGDAFRSAHTASSFSPIPRMEMPSAISTLPTHGHRRVENREAFSTLSDQLNAAASLPCSPPKPPLLMITT